MQIERSQRDGHIIVAINGPIILGESARQFSEVMAEILGEESRGVIVDLTHINYVDSTGLGELVGYLQRFNDAGRALALLNPHERITNLLKLTGLDKEFPTFTEIEEAIAALGG